MSLLRRLGRRIGHRFTLRAFDSVGRFPHFVGGNPYIENLGQLIVGDDFEMTSSPIQSHIITTPGALVRIGNGVRVGFGVGINAQSEIIIGDYSIIGARCLVFDSNFHEVRRRHSEGKPRPIVIGSGVRIGKDAVILQGVTIGDGAEIADGAVVSRSIPANVRASGVPARPESEGRDETKRSA